MKDSPKISEAVYWTTWHFVKKTIILMLIFVKISNLILM